MKKSEDAEITRAMAEMARQRGDRKQAEFFTAMAGVWERTDEEIDLLYDGKEDCTDAEEEIISSEFRGEDGEAPGASRQRRRTKEVQEARDC